MLALPQRSPKTVERALDLAAALTHGRQRIRNRVVRIVVRMNAKVGAPARAVATTATMRSTSCGSVPPLVSQSTTHRAPAS